jgi:general secretion pathway protein E
LLDIDDRMRTAITTNADSNVLRAEAIRSGMRPLKEDGWSKVASGVTTADEVLRVTEEF